jgi:hypothetical protein
MLKYKSLWMPSKGSYNTIFKNFPILAQLMPNSPGDIFHISIDV